jgi:hypothetical protein
MRVSFSSRCASPVGMALAVLAGCSAGVQPAPSSGVGPDPFAITRGLLAPQPDTRSHRHSRVRPNLIACTTVTARSGTIYTVAHVGAGSGLDIESSAYAGCTIGIYVPPSTENQGLTNNTMVNGPFGIGVYVDTVTGHLTQGPLSICVNGTTTTGSCKTGSLSSSGGAAIFWNTATIMGDHTFMDGYVAGFVTNPCPNPNNNITLDHTVITNSTYPWSYLGGNNNLNFGAGHNSPNNPVPGCYGNGVGAGGSNIYVADYNNNAAKQML